ncbi:MAG: NIPSNAP family protein, partial [Verrucomicrobiota bacterium]
MKILTPLLFAIVFCASIQADEDLTCYELRTYHANEGKLDALHARFRDHTVSLFEKHGMTNLIYWTPVENNDNLLIYLLAYPDRATRDASWKAFREDP